MPELPEVETVKRGLEKLILDKEIIQVDYDWDKSFPNSKQDVNEFVIGAKIKHIKRRAKVLLIELSTQYTLLTHLKMTGQLVFVGDERFGAGHPNDSLTSRLPDKTTRVTIQFKDKSHLYFNDQRKFGWVKLVPTTEVPFIDFMRKLGPEPLTGAFTSKEFIPRVRRRANTSIKAALLDQTVLAGVGNIYADESLFAAKIHPSTLVKNLDNQQLTTLLNEIKNVLQLAIEKGGSSDKNYVNAEGKKGSYISFARVFRREGKPCLVCGSVIEKSKVAGRGTHTCPRCQKK